MTTDLMIVPANTYLALADGGDIAEAMAANMGDAGFRESDLTRVTIPTGGSTTWIIPGLLQDEATPTIEGALVYQTVRGLLWAGDEPEEGALPVLISNDLRTARIVASDVPQHILDLIEVARIEGTATYDWTKLPQNEWGSGKNGQGKACKEQRVLFILRASEPLPLIVAIQPGSLKNWQQFIVSLTKAGIPYFRAIVSLSLEKAKSASGVAYAQVVPSLVGVLSKEDGKLLREKFGATMEAVAQSSFAG